MQIVKSIFIGVAIVASVSILISCKGKNIAVPPPAASINAVQMQIKNHQYTSEQVGIYDNLTVNGKTEINWIDTLDKKDEMFSDGAAAEIGTIFNFINDTAVTVTRKGKEINGTYKVVDKTDAFFKEEPGIKLKVTYADPEFGTGDFAGDITFTMNVLGINEESMLLQTTRTINDKKLLALYVMKK